MQTLIMSDTELIQDFQKTCDNATFNKILKQHEKLLKKLRHKFFNLLNLGITIDELEQEILISFYQAVIKFDHTKNCKFSTFCWRHICNDMCDLYGKQCNLYKHIVDNDIIVSDSDDGESALDLLTSIPDPIDIDDKYQENAYYNQIKDYINSLDNVTKAICMAYICNGLTQKQISKQLNISAMYVSRVTKKIDEQLHQIILSN